MAQSMLLELDCRYNKELKGKKKEALEKHLDHLRIVKPDMNELTEIEKWRRANDELWEYGKFVLDLADVGTFNSVDSEHTCIRQKYGERAFTFKIPYYEFKDLFVNVTGLLIREIKNENYGTETSSSD